MVGNCAKPFPERMVNPERFIQVYRRCTTAEAVFRADEIAREYRSQSPEQFIVMSEDCMWLLGAIYEAGRIQGKREERQRRHERSMSQM